MVQAGTPSPTTSATPPDWDEPDMILSDAPAARCSYICAVHSRLVQVQPEVGLAGPGVKGKKPGRKHKIAAQEAEESEPEVARVIDVRVPWRAPVARMI
jgi:hypothetical protein